MSAPSALLRKLCEQDKPLQLVGTVNAYSAMLAEQAGHQAIYLSGAGVANASFGLPDLAVTTLHDVCEDISRITSACELPLLVDADTGWGGAFNIARCVREMERAGAAGLHLEDQVAQKRCGHRPNKSIVSTDEMCDRIKAAVDAKTDSNFVIMARTDAIANEGLEGALERAVRFVEQGADALFPEAVESLEQYRAFVDAVDVPVLANITEFGATPLFTLDDLGSAGVSMALYPLSAFRAMSMAALQVYTELKQQGTQKAVVEQMQTREELYKTLRYHEYEQKLDGLYGGD